MKNKINIRKEPPKANGVSTIPQRVREGIFILTCTASVYFLLSLLTYHVTDPSWSSSGTSPMVLNLGGKVGAFLSDLFLYFFGYVAYFFPFLLTILAFIRMTEEKTHPGKNGMVFLRIMGIFFMIFSGCALLDLHLSQLHWHLPYRAGGILGELLDKKITSAFNPTGGTLFLLAAFASGITLLSGLSWIYVAKITWKSLISFFQRKWNEFKTRKPREEKKILPLKKPVEEPEPSFAVVKNKNSPKPEQEKIHIAPSVVTVQKSDRDQKERQMTLFKSEAGYQLPTLSLLDKNLKSKEHQISKATLEAQSKQVEQHLQDFGVEARVVAVHPGPVITRYELELAPGVKVSRITGLSKDLARSLSTVSVRVVEVIPGKAVIGLELPNEHREVVRLRDVIESQRYEQARSPLSLALGKDIAGHPVVVDIAKMPHLLVAGTTGSGKSVSLNAMLLSLLYKARPEEVRFILVDPKMLELSIYEGIPHLLTPVVTDMKEAAHALRWCVAEMDRRYRLMAHLGVRNLTGFNQKVMEHIEAKQPLLDPLYKPIAGETPPPLQPLPYIVVLIDEFADMMMVVGKKVEELIARIAQKARAAGIHLILATQRPSVDVITGLIKANIPTRIAFQVSSKIDSRTILDQQGAETLLGHGDMLYLPPGTGVPIRIHGAFVADEEVHKVVAELKKQGAPQYLEEILSSSGEDAQDFNLSSEREQDPLYDEAVMFVIQARKVSISSIQRRFKIGYNRAARIVEDMEVAGVVSAMEQNGSRDVLAPDSLKESIED